MIYLKIFHTLEKDESIFSQENSFDTIVKPLIQDLDSGTIEYIHSVKLPFLDWDPSSGGIIIC